METDNVKQYYKSSNTFGKGLSTNFFSFWPIKCDMLQILR